MTTKTIASVGLALILAAIATPAFAKRHTPVPQQSADYDRHSVSGAYYYGIQSSERPVGRVKSVRYGRVAYRSRYAAGGHSGGEAQMLPHPAGCPARAYCGCGAAVEAFGRPIRDLWLASNWIRKFPSAQPAPGMAAARSGHVFIIKEVLGNGMVLAIDHNSGGHQSRIHVRSLAGYHVVNPHGSRYAAN